MKNSVYLILLTLILISCAKANDPYKIPASEDAYEVIKVYPTVGYATEAGFGDNKIFVAESQNGFSMFDMTSGEELYNVNDTATSLLQDVEEIAYFEETNKLFAYNSGDPLGLRQFELIDNDLVMDPVVIALDNGADVRDFEFKYKNDTYYYSWYVSGTIHLSKLMNGEPTVLGQISDVDIASFSVSDSLIIVARKQLGVDVYRYEEVEYVPGFPQFDIEKIGTIDTPGEALYAVQYENVAYVADRHMGVAVLDLQNFELLHSYDVPFGYGRKISIENNLMAVTLGGGGVKVYDLTTPESPEEVLVLGKSVVGYTLNAYIYQGELFVLSRDMGVIRIKLL